MGKISKENQIALLEGDIRHYTKSIGYERERIESSENFIKRYEKRIIDLEKELKELKK